MWEQYHVDSAVVTFRPSVGTGSNGTVIIGIDYDPSDTTTTLSGAQLLVPRVRTTVYNGAEIRASPDRMNKSRWLFTAAGSSHTISEPMTGAFAVVISGQSGLTAGTVVGEVWIRYKCRFTSPSSQILSGGTPPPPTPGQFTFFQTTMAAIGSEGGADPSDTDGFIYAADYYFQEITHAIDGDGHHSDTTGIGNWGTNNGSGQPLELQLDMTGFGPGTYRVCADIAFAGGPHGAAGGGWAANPMGWIPGASGGNAFSSTGLTVISNTDNWNGADLTSNPTTAAGTRATATALVTKVAAAGTPASVRWTAGHTIQSQIASWGNGFAAGDVAQFAFTGIWSAAAAS
jgi:hypothetical protein